MGRAHSTALPRYAQALLQLAREAGVEERVGADLAALSETIAGHDELRRQLESPRLTRERKRALLRQLVGERGHDLVRRVALLLCDKGRAGEIEHLAGVYDAALRRAAGRAVARVESASPLDDGLRAALVERLGALSGLTVSLEEHVQPDLLGGLRVVLGSRMIDGSVTGQLDRMRARLLKAPLAQQAG